MIVTPWIAVRIALLVVAAVVLQVAGVAKLHVFDASPDLVPLLVGAIGLLGGSVAAASVGFSCGLLLDLALGQPLGSSSLVLTAVGYGVGRYREVRDPAHGLIPIPVGAAATAGYVLGFAALSFMLEIRAEVSGAVFRQMLITILLNSLVALLVFPFVRRTLHRALVADTGRRRRGTETAPTGPLGLRGLEV
jgi:rod shape-determining protein MreD